MQNESVLFRYRILLPVVLSTFCGAAAAQDTPAQTQPLKVYQNYDFQPGDKILFDDDFKADQNGEFPPHWKLEAGQAVVNKLEGENALFLIDGNYARVSPRMKTATYLGGTFTLEFDVYFKNGSYGPVVLFKAADDAEGTIRFLNSGVSMSGIGPDLSKDFAESFSQDFENKWHHLAIAVKDKQIKIYVDQIRALVMPDCECALKTVTLAGAASEEGPVIFKNVRLAESGGMTMLSKLTTDGKIVTHGILFDTGKAAIKPQSMGVINEIAKLLTENAGLKLEIEGYTDSDGNEQLNSKLSQDRADAVKAQLVGMGVNVARLTTKGFGATKPLDNNATPEGKSNNRRVEFVKVG